VPVVFGLTINHACGTIRYRQARKIAGKIVRDHNLLSKHTIGPFRLKFGGFGASLLAIQSNDARKEDTLLVDTRVLYKTTVDIPGNQGTEVVGGGGEFQIVLGDEERLIGFHGISRHADSTTFNAAVIPRNKPMQLSSTTQNT
jgi:hypothetical protein